MAKETQIGSLVIDLQIKTQALEKGLETARKKIQEIENQNNQLQNSNKQIDASFLAMSATAVLAINQIINVVKECVNEYNDYTQAMAGLQNISDYTGQSISSLEKIMNRFSQYGLVQSDIAAAIKNFTIMGYTAEETEQMIEALTNSAISNRQACYSVSEAVKMASEGYKNGISTLSDAAGVTENLSVMESKYAESIGKTVGQLTEAEKNQAYLNRTMYAAEPFAGAMADYMDTLAGKQGAYSQALRETQIAYAEALEPTLVKMEKMKTEVLGTLGDLISSHEIATTEITTFVATLATLAIGITAVKKAYDTYKASALAATVATKGFTAALASNPLGAIAVAISVVISALASYTTATEKQREAQARLNEETKLYNDVISGNYGYTQEKITKVENKKNELEDQIDLLQKIIEKRKEIQALTYSVGANSEAVKNAKGELEDYIKEYEELADKEPGSTEEITKTMGSLSKKVRDYTKYLKEANAIENISKAFEVEKIKNQQKEAAQLKINAQTMQSYLNTVKNGDKTTIEYQNAVNELAKAYPEASTAGGVLINVLEGLIGAEQLQADEAWNASQTAIQGHINNIQIALQDESVQQQVAQNMGIAYDENFKPKLESILALLQMIGNYTPDTVPNITPASVSTPKISSSSSSAYSNKALDNYKKEIEHKKAMDQISLKQEITMYETALQKYAKTADEKMELREKIYELNKELAKKEKEILEQQTEDYETYIQEQKNLRGAEYDVKDQTRDYDKIIAMHKNYLNQIMKDERLSLEERKEIYREELQTIREYEQQKRDLRVEAIDNTVSHLTNAITKQLEEMYDKDKELIDKNLEDVEKWKEERINAINEEYDARIEAIEKELEALEKAEQQKTRDEEDAEYEKKKLRLQQLIEFEHDATNKANYQKELDKLVAEYQKTLDARALEDKKEALNEQKELLQQEQDDKLQAIEDETDKKKEEYEKQLDDLEKYYDEQIDKAQETAEKMLLNVEQNQEQILSLLQSYGDAYEITGQSLGEKLAQGINEGLASKIESAIQNFQDTIDRNLEIKITEWEKARTQYEAGAGKPQTQSINIYQTNNIEQNPELPSETYRKLRNISEELAAQLSV